MEELTFTGINVRAFINEILAQTKESITNGMSKGELKAFDFGVETVISQLEQYSENEDFVVIAGDNPSEEFVLGDLLDTKGLEYEIEPDEDENGDTIYRIMAY